MIETVDRLIRRCRRDRGAGAAIAAVVLLLSACVGMREQAEDVFLEQNRLSAALGHAILAAEMEQDLKLAEALYDRESVLSDACGALQRAGYRSLYDETVDGGLQLEAFAAVEPCRVACRETADFLRHADPEVAEAFLPEAVGAGALPRPTRAAGLVEGH